MPHRLVPPKAGRPNRTGRSPSGSPRKRFLSTQELDAVAREIARSAKEHGVAVAALGGYAMQAYGSDRFTVDLDVVADSMLPLPPGEPLTFGGHATHSSPSGLPVDVILRDDAMANLYDEALASAKRIPGIPIRVVRPEHLVAMKMEAGREKDDLDLGYLLLMLDEKDYTAARKVVVKHLGYYAGKELDARLAEAQWKRSRGLT